IVRSLGRRDDPPASDLVTVVVDATRSRRTAYAFAVNAGGVLQDGLYFDGDQFNPDWDGVWEASAAIGPDGWSAEFAIPLSLLGLTDSAPHLWGFHVRRSLPRTNEEIDTALIPPSATQFVSRFLELGGVEGLAARSSIEIVPYAAARASLAPQYEDPARPRPRIFNPSMDIGADLQASVTRNLSLTAALNPDFGQVEADRLVINLSNVELFFPEKRPFFTRWMDLFVPVGMDDEDEGQAPQMLFYSRRIGLETPILGAVKVLGHSGERTEAGVLDVVEAGVPNPSKVGSAGLYAAEDAPPDRRFAFHAARPFHLGPHNELPDERPVAMNFFAAVARRRVLESSRIDALFTDATPLSKACYRRDFATEEEYRAANCHAEGSRALGLAWDLRTSDRHWGTWGQIAGSQINGFSRPRLLRDGTEIGPGAYGWGTYARFGKLDGEPFRIFLQYEHASPRFEINRSGFLQTQNQQSLWAEARFVHSAPLGPVRDWFVAFWGAPDWTTDGRVLNRSYNTGFFSEALLPAIAYTGISAYCEYAAEPNDIREIPEKNIPYERAPSATCGAGFWTNESHPVVLKLDAFRFENLPKGVLLRRGGYGGEGTLTVRPTPALETEIIGRLDRSVYTARYLGDVDGDSFRFADLLAVEASLQLKQQMVISPELTLQGYAQLLTAHGHYGPFYEANYVGRPIKMTDLRGATGDPLDYDFRTSALAINLILRWEYRRGSVLYAVYSRNQENLPVSGVATPGLPGLTLVGLGRGLTTDTFLVKWSWYWDG
ncbi:MAG TPA: DUF5916 domain-containing protein, partial [Myxococcaceae bacterium]|nr:DUF5916 domain-containing protein [Myxococcaceae bacterium]